MTIPANSPPVTLSYTDAEACGQGSPCYFTSYSLTSAQSWSAITSINFLPSNPAAVAQITYTIDVSGLAPGVYCLQHPFAFTSAGTVQCIAGGCFCETPAGLFQVAPGTICTEWTSTTILRQITVSPGTAGVTLVDPVPNLVSGSGVLSAAQLQNSLTQGRVVKGTVADGVTQLIIRIDTSSPNHQFTITLTNDQGLSGANIIPNEDGALGLPGASSFSSGQVTVAAGTADSNGMAHAFAVYRAPVDFARPSGSGFKSGTCNGSNNTDDQLACRAVSIQVQDITTNASLGTLPITILRPMVTAVHGLWSDWTKWDNFSPLVTGKNSTDSRFFVHRANYKNPISITASTPTYPTQQLQKASGDSLGFQYNAGIVLTQINKSLNSFKGGQNPLGVPVAAIQVDVVGHSMGGDIARTIASLPQFLNDANNPSFGQGSIHKVITIDTPHLGSRLAQLLLIAPPTNPNNACTAQYLAAHTFFSFQSVTLSGSTVSGAIGDLAPGSTALNNIANGPITHLLPTALIAGIYTNFASLDPLFSKAAFVRNHCTNDPLSQSLTSNGWPENFLNAQNDAIVDVNSQLNGFSSSAGVQFTGYVHSQGTENLGFTSPSVLDPNVVAPQTISVPNQVIKFLNTPVTNQAIFNSLNP